MRYGGAGGGCEPRPTTAEQQTLKLDLRKLKLYKRKNSIRSDTVINTHEFSAGATVQHDPLSFALQQIIIICPECFSQVIGPATPQASCDLDHDSLRMSVPPDVMDKAPRSSLGREGEAGGGGGLRGTLVNYSPFVVSLLSNRCQWVPCWVSSGIEMLRPKKRLMSFSVSFGGCVWFCALGPGCS